MKKKLRRLLWRMLNRLRVEMAYLYIPAFIINPIFNLLNEFWVYIPLILFSINGGGFAPAARATTA